ncbi:MAG TPA: hypothetical protein VK524_09815 [Polyangiaceae bacterium]|nr:hypothetical protein [Polyangiaceae bacterium]
MALASAVGLGAELGLGVTGVLAGYALCNDRDELFGCAGHVTIGMLAGGMLGAIGGVQLTADAMNGDGKLWATTLGGVGGTAAGLTGFVALYDYDDEEPGIALLPLFVGPVLGAVVGYELSASSPGTQRKAETKAVNVAAMPSKHGGMELAVYGRF